MISRVVLREELGRVGGIARGDIEIDDRVVRLAGANPLVDQRALGLALLREVRRAFKRGQRRAVNPQPSGVGPLDQLLVPGDDVFGGRRRVLTRLPDVIDAFQHDHVRDAGLPERIRLESRQRVKAGIERPLAQHAISTDARIQHGHPRAARLRHQPLGEEIRPAIVRVRGRAGAVGNRIPERDDRADRFGRHHLHPRKQEPRRGRRDHREGGRAHVIAGLRHVAGLQRAVVHRQRRRGVRVARHVEVDGQIRHRRHVEVDWVGVHDRAARNGDGRPPAEGQLAIRARHDPGVLLAQRQMRLGDGEWYGAEPVTQHHARPSAADARVHDLAERLVVEVHERHGRRRCGGGLTLRRRGRGGWRRGWRRSLRPPYLGGGPGTDPVLAGSAALREHRRVDREEVKDERADDQEDGLPLAGSHEP